jgi:DnaD/phage-associated family protein
MSKNQQKAGRVLSRSISLSESMADIGDPCHILIATWLIPHADDQGRMVARQRKLKAQVFPMLDAIAAVDITSALENMAEVGMVQLYTAPDGTPLLQFLSWWKWNDGQRWIYASNFPAPDGWQDRVRVNNKDVPQTAEVCGSSPQDSGAGDGVGVGVVVGGGEGSMEYGEGVGVGEGVGATSATGEVFRTYEREIGAISPTISEDIIDLLDGSVPPDWIIAALSECAKYNVRSWAYARTIIERWQREGRRDPTGPPGNGSPGGQVDLGCNDE